MITSCSVPLTLTPNDFTISGTPQDDVLAILAPPRDSGRGITSGPTSEHRFFLLLDSNIRGGILVDDVWRHCGQTKRSEMDHRHTFQLNTAQHPLMKSALVTVSDLTSIEKQSGDRER